MSGQPLAILPYCGAPPAPDALWSRWNFDPVLIVVLVVMAAAYAAGARKSSRDRQFAFFGGWSILAAALISPLCALSVSLFAARVGQHMILTLVAAPLIAAGRPVTAARRLCGPPGDGRQPERIAAPILAAGMFAAMLWFWHAPVPYALTFASTTLYWLMHVSTIAAAIWLWSELLDARPGRALTVVAAGVISCLQMGLLGALITLAPRAVYAPHALTTSAWGLSPLADQQLGGAIMWIPGGIVFLVVAMLGLRLMLTGGTWQDQPAPRVGLT